MSSATREHYAQTIEAMKKLKAGERLTYYEGTTFGFANQCNDFRSFKKKVYALATGSGASFTLMQAVIGFDDYTNTIFRYFAQGIDPSK